MDLSIDAKHSQRIWCGICILPSDDIDGILPEGQIVEEKS
jgi:hypothetical protein